MLVFIYLRLDDYCLLGLDVLCIRMSDAIDGWVLTCLLFSVLSCGVYCQITHSTTSFGHIALFCDVM